MQKEFPFLKSVDRTGSEELCSLCDGMFNVTDGEELALINTSRPRNTTKVQKYKNVVMSHRQLPKL